MVAVRPGIGPNPGVGMAIDRLKAMVRGTALEEPLKVLLAPLIRPFRTEWVRRAHRDDKAMRRLLKRVLRPDSNVVDVGCNVGEFLEQVRRHAPRGTHVAVEPLPHLAEALAARFPNVRVERCALGAEPGVATFHHVVEMTGWSGFNRQDYPRDVTVEEIEVAVRTLDEVVGEEATVDLVKIDVEGAEMSALRGGRSLFRRARPVVIFEHARVHNRTYGTTPEEVHDLLVGECGYEIRDLSLSERFDREGLRRIFDRSFETDYDRNAHTNFVAWPVGRG